ncbi:hypothetical protein AADZ86_06050 [Colwelliaceae bacterium BS250]
MTVLISLTVIIIFIVIVILKTKNIDLWLGHYLLRKLTAKKSYGTKHVMFCFVDHFEPQWGHNISIEQERARVDRWLNDYPQVAKKFKDADGCHPKHCFYYPEEEYRQEHLDKIANICAQDLGEIEIHLHHDNDSSENLLKTLTNFTQLLHENHGAFSRHPVTGLLQYSFIHGNWCLNNSNPDGTMCGVNDELVILRDTGCYADLTFPSAPSPTQPAFANEIYYASDNPGRPNSHNKGEPVASGKPASGDLMMITGPLGLNFKQRKAGVLPKIENADIRDNSPPTLNRIKLWIETAISVLGRPEWIFIKVHTHGTQEKSMDTLLGEPFEQMCRDLDTHYNDGKNYVLHYVSAREMYNIIKAAEANKTGNPNQYRDFIIDKPNYQNKSENARVACS